jgi:hypothetical protein
VFAGDGDQRYIEAVDGNRYFEGARMKQGPTVVSIGADEVVFDVDGRRVTMPLGGKAAGTPVSASAAEAASAASAVKSGAATGVAMPVSGTTASEVPPSAQAASGANATQP